MDYSSKTNHMDRSAKSVYWRDDLDGPVLLIWNYGLFIYSKIALSVCTLSQLLSLTKALLSGDRMLPLPLTNLNDIWEIFQCLNSCLGLSLSWGINISLLLLFGLGVLFEIIANSAQLIYTYKPSKYLFNQRFGIFIFHYYQLYYVDILYWT